MSSCKICKYAKRDVSSKLFIFEVNAMLQKGDRYSSIIAVWKYHNRFLKAKKWKTISKWSLSHHKNNCLSSDNIATVANLPEIPPEAKSGIRQGDYLLSGWYCRCKECGFILHGEGFNDKGVFFEHIEVLSKKTPIFYAERNAWRESCPKCNGELQYSSGRSSIVIERKKRRSLRDMSIDALTRLMKGGR